MREAEEEDEDWDDEEEEEDEAIFTDIGSQERPAQPQQKGGNQSGKGRIIR